MSRKPILYIMFAAVLALAFSFAPSYAHQGETSLVSVSPAWTPASGDCGGPSVSTDGRYVAFYSRASNLVAGDTNGHVDVFVRDRLTKMTERASVSSARVQADGDSWAPAISADGRYVAFESIASNLVTGDTNDAWDVFVHDRVTGVTERVSVASSTGAQANGNSYAASISADGRYVTFQSKASNLVTGDTNGDMDVFVHDRVTGETVRMSESSSGAEADGPSRTPVISANGRLIAFVSAASNLVTDDTNGVDDVFVHDRVSGYTERVSVTSLDQEADGASDNPSISSDGNLVAFDSAATNLVPQDTNGKSDVFVRNRLLAQTDRVSVSTTGKQGNGDSTRPAISLDGSVVVFESQANVLVANDLNSRADIFINDGNTGETKLVSVTTSGDQANDDSGAPSVSSEGRFVAFESQATNLVTGDTNANTDVFIHQLLPDVVQPEFHDVAIIGLRIAPGQWAQGVPNQFAIMDIGNFGNVAETGIHVKWLLDDDADFNDAATDPTPPTELGSKTGIALAPGEKKTIQIALTPSWPRGTYYLMGRVEPTAGKTDVNRANNSKQAKIEIVTFDFKLMDIAWSKTKGAIIVRVTNNGPSRGFSRVSVSVAGTRVLYHGLQDAYLFTEVGESRNVEFAYTPPSTTSKWYKVDARVKPANDVPDAHPADNVRSEYIKMP